MSQSSAQAGAPASSVVLNGSNGIDTSPGAPKTAKTAGWAAAKGKGSDAARCEKLHTIAELLAAALG